MDIYGYTERLNPREYTLLFKNDMGLFPWSTTCYCWVFDDTDPTIIQFSKPY